MANSKTLIEIGDNYGAHNYHPLPVVLAKGEGIWVWDVEGNKYLDFLASYSAVNQGHCHPRLVKVMSEQAGRLTLTSRAFHNDKLGPFLKDLCELTGFEMALPMNSGAEAVETAIKAVRRWGYQVKKIPTDKAEIIVCSDNFHGRTTTIVGFSTDEDYKVGFGPFTPGFKAIPYGDAAALEKAITPNTAAFLVEPIQGEAGVVVPPEGYLRKTRELCAANNVLFVADEIQVGFGRTGKMFCCDHEGVKPDMLILGKAMGGGMYPVSAIVADREIMNVFDPGSHGSTFGGNPLAAAVAREAMQILKDEKLVQRAAELGDWFMDELRALNSPHVAEVRGKGLLIGVRLKSEAGGARSFCERLQEEGMLCKETHIDVIRFAPPLTIEKSELQWALERIRKVLT
ncbi:MAG: ornithine--oxo-acid transaminase [Acidobacteriota bacterium]|nr:ornithine--oxo-acid transaminase [Acidobacteriota bacterium]